MKKTWKDLLAEGRVEKLPAGAGEIEELWSLAKRNLRDASIEGLSAEGKFEFAYNAARTMATIAIRQRGYRVKSKGGHHWDTFIALETALGDSVAKTAAYFDQCRQKRNDVIYDVANAVSQSEADELLAEAKKFATLLGANQA